MRFVLEYDTFQNITLTFKISFLVSANFVANNSVLFELYRILNYHIEDILNYAEKLN